MMLSCKILLHIIRHIIKSSYLLYSSEFLGPLSPHISWRKINGRRLPSILKIHRLFHRSLVSNISCPSTWWLPDFRRTGPSCYFTMMETWTIGENLRGPRQPFISVRQRRPSQWCFPKQFLSWFNCRWGQGFRHRINNKGERSRTWVRGWVSAKFLAKIHHKKL